MTPEAKVKKQVKSILDELECYYFFPATGGFGRSGVPDIVACVEGKFVGIECKANGNKPTLLQERNLEQIKSCGGSSIVVNEDNVDNLKEWIQGELAS
jgi:Holliday junction resolvase